MSFSWTVEAIHVPTAPDPDIFRNLPFGGEEECLGARARVEGNELVGEEGVGKKERNLASL